MDLEANAYRGDGGGGGDARDRDAAGSQAPAGKTREEAMLQGIDSAA